MPRTHIPHRIVTRNAEDRIISDVPHDSFADAKPAYDRAAADVEAGHVVTLQHGARVIFRSEG